MTAAAREHMQAVDLYGGPERYLKMGLAVLLLQRPGPFFFDSPRPLRRIEAGDRHAHHRVADSHREEHAGIEERGVACMPRHVSSPGMTNGRDTFR